jgi:site-specific recombinase XerD
VAHRVRGIHVHLGAKAEAELLRLALQGEVKTAALRRSENTRAGYRADWRSFTAWCAALGHESLPASVTTILLYSHAQLEAGRKVSTAIRRLSAINSYHTAAGYDAPAGPQVWQFLLAVRRMRGEQPRQKQALTVDQLRRMCQALPLNAKGWRDRSVLTLGFGSGLRRSTLVALDLADVEFCPEGVILTIHREKQDRKGEGRRLGVVRGTQPDTCPVGTLETWIDWRGREPGPLFTPAIGGRVQLRRLRPAHVARIVKDAARRIGLDPTHLAGHSMRSGMVTTALENGCNEVLVMAHTAHQSLATLRKYLRRADPFRANASAMLGL